MSLFNPITAFCFGVLAAAYWAILFLRRTLRNPKYLAISATRKAVAWIAATLALIPGLALGFVCGSAIGSMIGPGAAVHILLSLSLAACMATIGAAFAYFAGAGMLKVLSHKSSTA